MKRSSVISADNDSVIKWRRVSGEQRLAYKIIGETMLSVTSRSERVRKEALESIDSTIFEHWCKVAGIERDSLKSVLEDPIARAAMKKRLEEFLETDAL